MLLKFFQNWSGGGGGSELSPFFTFLKFCKISVFCDYLENPLRYVSVPKDKKVSTHDKKTFDVVFFDPRFKQWRGEGKSVIFDYLNYLVTPSRYINTCGEKSYYS